jgi:exodeoxyribonuclease-3
MLPGASRCWRGCRATFILRQKKGYSGVGIYTRHEPSDVMVGYNSPEFDAEGRYVELRFDTPAAQAVHHQRLLSPAAPRAKSASRPSSAFWMFHPHLMALKAQREFILCGDVNIAHQQIDLKNWRSNQKNSGFLPEERAWMTKLLHTTDPEGGWWTFTVSYNLTPPTRPTPGGATGARPMPTTWAGGWITTWPPPPGGTGAHRAIYKGEKFSDHAPITVEYDFAL